MNKKSNQNHRELDAHIRRTVAAEFAKADRPAVLAALGRYRSGRDVARVRRAILRLSDGNMREVERLVEMAHENLRDLIRRAESPERSGVEDRPG